MKMENMPVIAIGPSKVMEVLLTREPLRYLPQKVKRNYILFLPLLSSAESFSSESSKGLCEDFSAEKGDLDTLLCSGSSLDLEVQKTMI